MKSRFWISAVCAIAMTADAQDAASGGASSKDNATSEAPKGLLPVPDYSGDFWDRSYVTDDWYGFRTDWANKGFQFGMELNQYAQGVAAGGRDQGARYGGNADYLANFDLMRMGVLQGALIKFRAESRFGSSVNRISGSILPVNTDALFPLSSKPDRDVPFTITDLNYTQFLSQHFGVTFGKLDTLDGDPNEFASGRGTSQFMNANFIFNPTLALRLPYSTLGAGIVWIPVVPGRNGGITVSSIVMNTQDSSTTTGFGDFGDGVTWYTEADFQYWLGELPGGMNVGGLYSFDQNFAHLNSRFVFTPGEGLTVPSKNSTWAVYWSGWQYLVTWDAMRQPLELLNGRPDCRGIGLFSRFGFADKDTNPVEWAISGGVGGRGVVPCRDNDTFGVGYYYNRIQRTRLSSPLGLERSTQGFECFYNVAITPALLVTLDLQVVKPVQESIDTATILGLRASLNF